MRTGTGKIIRSHVKGSFGILEIVHSEKPYEISMIDSLEPPFCPMGEQVLFWCVFFTNSGYFQKKSHKNMIQENYNTPHSTPQAIPLASYERNPFIACWERFRGVFQRCGETTLDMYRLLPRQLTCPLKSWKLEDYGSYLSLLN